MPELHPEAAFRDLITRGLIAGQPVPLLLALGNVDRREPTARRSWCVALPTGGRAKLTLGFDLASLAARHAAFAQACPEFVPTQLFFTRLNVGEALAESFFEGFSLQAALQDNLATPAALGTALGRVVRGLAATEQTSTESARVKEWQEWCDRLLALAIWELEDRAILQQGLLPALYARLAVASPVTRWTNGDFLPANLLLNPSGEARLIDHEFAARTHFFVEDAVRFRVLSGATRDRPEIDAALPVSPGLPWHLYFWLRQFHLEAEHNTTTYLERYRTTRLGLIRRLGEQVLGADMSRWSTPALSAEYRVEDVRWSADSDRAAVITGWCCPPAGTGLRGITAVDANDLQLVTVASGPRPDVQQHFGGVDRAHSTGFTLRLDPPTVHWPVTLCAILDQGTLLPFHALPAEALPRGRLSWEDYPDWAARYDPDPPVPAVRLPNTGPLFSILLPVYQTPEDQLRDCIKSVRAQHYPQWELCVVDDGSGSPGLTDLLNQFAAADPRIRLQPRMQNGGISRATNDALALAQGQFVILLDHDDLLRPHALAEFADLLGRCPTLDAVYSDEDKITADGQRIMPLLKPDFSPEFLRGVMYAGHALCVRTTTARAAGGFDPRFDGVQDFEFLLRVSEQTRQIGHIPRTLYHWRQSAASSALHGNVKGNMDERQAAAVQAHLNRIGDPRLAAALGGHRVRLAASIPPSHTLIQAAQSDQVVALLRQHAQTSDAEVLILMTAGLVAEGEDWLQQLGALAALPDSGCVGPVLLSAGGRVHESGRLGENLVMRGFHSESDGYHGSLRCSREVDAISAHCFAIKRTLVLSLPELPGEDWPDFCRQLRSQGLYHRICAIARVSLPAGWTEGVAPTPAAPSASGEFYNPQFDPLSGDYALATPTRPSPQRPATLRFNLEQPLEWENLSRCVIIRGWCFASGRAPINAIRLRTGDLMLAGVIGLPRPDVKRALPEDAPDDRTGFEIRGTLPGGSITLTLEARLSDGTWHELITRNLEIKRRFLPLWLGGGDWTELMFFQMPAHMAYSARPIAAERFPRPTSQPRPKLSIVTPSFNQARFLPETMRSVLEQAGVDCSYVVQDGGSSDGSAEIIRRLSETGDRRRETGGRKPDAGNSRENVVIAKGADPAIAPPASSLPPPASRGTRLIAWESSPDNGQADATVRAFAKTSGAPDDLMAWINSDDFYLPGALAFVADYFARHPEVDAVYGHRIVVNEESREVARWFLPQHDPEVLRLNDFVPQETLFWRRRIWDKVGGIDSSFAFAMDWDLLLRFQAAGANIVRVPHFLACFRIHSAQKTSARMHDLGRLEIDRLRERAQGRPFPPGELERHPRLLRYLRRSAFIQSLWKLGLRAR